MKNLQNFGGVKRCLTLHKMAPENKTKPAQTIIKVTTLESITKIVKYFFSVSNSLTGMGWLIFILLFWNSFSLPPSQISALQRLFNDECNGCSCSYVICQSNNTVLEIEDPGGRMGGEAQDLANFSDLQRLTLFYSHTQGSVGDFFSQLPSLSFLDIS